ncbi:MAG: hypothetical protein HOP00_13790 [Nitrospira sp.]|nr:hypothetical protein [Nitrospira sp.]
MNEDYGTLRVGYVYLLINSAVPGFVKIGMTTRSPSDRARELSSTGVPGRWEVDFCIFVPDCAAVERIVHDDLKHCRFSDDREFFGIALPEAQAAIQRRADENMAACPGWPDPQSVKSHVDKQELQNRQEAETQRLQRELERAAAEKKKQEGEARERQARHKNVDESTREMLSRGPVGWGTFVFAGFWLIVDGKPAVSIVAAVVTIAAGFWLRAHEKAEARKLRSKWELPSV